MTRLGEFLVFLCQNLLTKLAKQFGDFLGCFEDINYQLITVVATRLGEVLVFYVKICLQN